MASHGVREYTEAIRDPPYEGTIIEVETNHDHLPFCVGTLHDHHLAILYITDDDPDSWTLLAHAVTDQLTQLPRPYLAFRATYDQETLAALVGRPLVFDGDLHVLPHGKDRTARALGAPIIPDLSKDAAKMSPKPGPNTCALTKPTSSTASSNTTAPASPKKPTSPAKPVGNPSAATPSPPPGTSRWSHRTKRPNACCKPSRNAASWKATTALPS